MMTTEKSKNNWVKRGFGWIPDLPDIADPDLSSALSHKTQILTREGAGHVEEIAARLIDILNNENLVGIIGDDNSLKEAQKKLLGETYFPNVQIYKILRKGVSSQEKEVMKLRKALYLIYSRSLLKSVKDASTNRLLESISAEEGKGKDGEKGAILPKGRIKLVHWLQDSNFDENLERLVKAFQSGVGLLSDGIVGLRTYSAIEDLLSEDEKILQEVNLLCPTSLIPHEILEEIFEHLSFLWLHGKFRHEIQNAFQCFCDSYPLSMMQVEKVRQAQQELERFLHQQLKDINTIFRGSIEEFHNAGSNSQDENTVAINAHIHKNLIIKLGQLQTWHWSVKG